ncbi:MAG: VWA domain-containing protein [Halioglobus sp.]|nr:VWA domain-containing protein [Halioglobus sp.]
MPSNLVSFIQVLRTHDVRVSPAESLDAVDVAATLGYGDRTLLRDGLAMTLAKTPEEEAIFTQCFDRFFSQGLADFANDGAQEQAGDDTDGGAEGDHDEGDAAGQDNAEGGSDSMSAQMETLDLAAGDNASLQALMQSTLMQNLLDNNRNELTLAMAQAAERVGLQDIQMFTQRGQFTRRILDEMGEEQIRDAVIELEQAGSPALPIVQRYRDILREQVRDYVEHEYLLHAEGRNQQFMEEILSKTRLNNIEHVYLHRVQELIRKMARKLASRHARKRRRLKRGQLDMPRTLRKGIPNDGVMFNTYWRQVRKEKPQILAVCDVSGSVAAYAKFLLLFLYSLQDVLPRVRSFAFSSYLGEVSHYFDDYPVEEAIELVNWKFGGATDYGNSLLDFASLALDDINSNTTVIILGDARNNNGDPRLDLMQGIYKRSRQVIWLNPESRRSWGTGDSEMLRYQSACHFSAECNNLKQLERIVDQLLKSTR